MRKRALLSPVCIACLGAALMVSTAEAAKVQVYVKTQDGKVLSNPTVTLKGQTTAAKTTPSSPAVFNVEENKIEILVGAEGKRAAAGLVLPEEGDVHVVMVTLPANGNRATARIVTADDSELGRPFYLPRDVDYVHGQTGIQHGGALGLSHSPLQVAPGSASSAVAGIPCGASAEVTNNNDPGVVVDGSSVQCGQAGVNAGNQMAQLLNGTGDVQCVEFGVETSTPMDWNVTVEIHGAPTGDPNTDIGAGPTGGPNLLGSVLVTVPADTALGTVLADFSSAGVTVAGDFWVVISSPSDTTDSGGTGTQFFFPGANVDTAGISYIQSAACGLPYTDTAGIGFPDSKWVISVGLGTPEPGACCDTDTGTCEENVLPADCEGVSSPGVACIDAGCVVVIPCDECDEACDIGTGDTVAIGDTTNNTGSTGDDTSCAFDDTVDEWLVWTAGCNGTADFSMCNTADYDTALSLWSDCGTEIDCNDDAGGCGLTSALLGQPIAAGTQYFIRVSGFGGASGNYTLDISQTCDVPETGADNCVDGPSAITGEGNFQFDNGAASTDGFDDVLCDAFGSLQVENDVWFCWTSTCEGDVRVETCGLTDVDTKIAAYDGCDCPTGAGSPPAIACNDDTCGLQSQIQFSATNGGQYLFRIGTFPGAAGGVGEFSVSCVVTGSVCNLDGAGNCQDYDTANASQSNDTAFRSADDFSPSASGSITEVCWWGAYLDSIVDDDLTVTYYDDGGGLPGAAIGVFTGGDLTLSGPVDTGDLVAGLAPIYSYSATHAAVDVTGGECYWLEVKNNTVGATWFWEDSLAGNGVRWIDAGPDGYDGGDAQNLGVDFAWCLNVELGEANCFQPPVCPDDIFTGCGQAGAGDCQVPNGTPACDNVDCCCTICALDSFCCDVEWDGICADAAAAEPACQGAQGACCQTDGSCTVTSESSCSGTWLGDGTTCDECPAVGACCTPDGACAINTEANCDAAMGVYNGDGTTCASSGPSVDSGASSPGLAIPDGDPAGTSDSLNLAASNVIGGVEVTLDVSHTWIGDLCVTISHGGTDVVVVQRVSDPALGCAGGCCACNAVDMAVTLSDGASASLGADYAGDCGGGPGPMGIFLPQEALSAFNGMDASGDWTLTIADNAGADTGILNSWGVEIFGEGEDPCDPIGACCGCPDENACTITTEASCAEPGVWLGEGTDCDLPPGDTTDIDSGAVSIPIPDGDPAGTSHTLNMGMSYALTDVAVSLDISHTWVGDICATLSHGGTDVVVVQRVSDPGLGCDGGCCACNAVDMVVDLSDDATNPIGDYADCAGGAGPMGLFIPQEALSAFDGMDSAGEWTLTVADNASADSGTLNSWSLHLTAPAEGGGPCEGQCSECGNGILEAGEDCDDGNTDDGDCCSATCTLDASGTACGDAADDECTNPDSCDGAGNCQANDEAAGTLCGSAATECSDQDTCNGSGICSANDLPSGTACGTPADPENCFSGDACTGGGNCQAGFIITECGPADGCCNAGAGCNFTTDPDCPEGVPTVSEWGLVILALLLAIAAKVYWNRREAIA